MYHPIKEKNMQELAGYQIRLRSHPRLRYLFFELTDKCNLNCRHCGSACTGNNDTYLDVAVVSKVMKEVKEKYGTSDLMICLTGGEPLLHPDAVKVIAEARALGFPVGMTTNGTLIDSDTAKKLVLSGLDTIAVSLDGLGRTHDEFRVATGSFDKAVQGIHFLKEYGLEPEVLTVVHKGNYGQLEEMYHFLRSEDIYSWRLVNVEPIGRALGNPELLLSPGEMKGLLDFIREKRFDNENDMEVTYGCSHFTSYEYENEIRDYYFQCGAGTFVAGIMADGSIGACLDIERRKDLVQGNVYQDSFTEVWENRFEVFRRDRSTDSSTCRSCGYRGVCLGDSAHTWDYDENEPRYCLMKGLIEGNDRYCPRCGEDSINEIEN